MLYKYFHKILLYNMVRISEAAVKISAERPATLCERVLFLVSLLLAIISFPLSLFACIIITQEYERAVIFRLGRLRNGGLHGPGIIWVLPCIDSYCKIDLRTAAFNVAPQDVLTKDSVTIKLDAVIYYRFVDPLRVTIQVANIRASTEMLAQTTLRNVAGTKTLIELLSSKESLSKQIEEILDRATDPWGVKVERVEVSDIKLPHQLQRAMAVEQEAERAARAKVAAAEGELQSATALKEASDVMATNKLAIQLRYLQTLNTIANEKTKNIIFPFPTDIIRGILNTSKPNLNCSSMCSVCKEQLQKFQEPPPQPQPQPQRARTPNVFTCEEGRAISNPIVKY